MLCAILGVHCALFSVQCGLSLSHYVLYHVGYFLAVGRNWCFVRSSLSSRSSYLKCVITFELFNPGQVCEETD